VARSFVISKGWVTAYSLQLLGQKKSGLGCYVVLSSFASTKKYDFVAKLAKWLLTEGLRSCKTAESLYAL
jgi:hypothetical protein